VNNQGGNEPCEQHKKNLYQLGMLNYNSYCHLNVMVTTSNAMKKVISNSTKQN
jgi:hypothetical protein